jgi:hypothetical protein
MTAEITIIQTESYNGPERRVFDALAELAIADRRNGRQIGSLVEGLGTNAVAAEVAEAMVAVEPSVVTIPDVIELPTPQEWAKKDGSKSIVLPVSMRPTTQQVELVEKYQEMRVDYLQAMGWVEAQERDHDRYDDNANTLYILSTRPDEEEGDDRLVCGMRFTPIESIHGSLTWEMMKTAPAMRWDAILNNFSQIRDANTVGQKGRLWDITRLVTPIDTADEKEILHTWKNIVNMIGAGVATTCEDNREEGQTYWMFLTTPKFQQFLEIAGITHTVLTKGKVSPDDAEDSYLCMADPIVAYNRLKESDNPMHRRVLKEVEHIL